MVLPLNSATTWTLEACGILRQVLAQGTLDGLLWQELWTRNAGGFFMFLLPTRSVWEVAEAVSL